MKITVISFHLELKSTVAHYISREMNYALLKLKLFTNNRFQETVLQKKAEMHLNIKTKN